MNRLLRRTAGISHGHRRTVLLAALGVAVVAAVLAGNVSAKLDQGATGSTFEATGSQVVRADELLRRATGLQAQPGVLVLVRPGASVDSPAGRRAVAGVVRTLRGDAAIGRVVDPLGADAPVLVSADHRTALVVAYLRALGGDASYAAGKAVQRQFADRPGTSLGGSLIANVELSEQIQHDLQIAEIIGLPVVFLLALWVFRGFVAALLPIGTGAVTILVTMLVLRALLLVTPISVYAINMVTGLGLGLSIDYSLLMVSRYREELAAGGAPAEVLARTVSTAGRTVLFSAATVTAAMASLLFFPLPFMVSMGIGGVVAPIVAALVAVVALPAALAGLGSRLVARRRGRRAGRAPGVEGWSAAWERIGRSAVRHALPTALLGIAALLLVAVPALSMRFIGTTAGDLPAGASARQVARVAAATLPRATSPSFDLVVSAPPSDAPSLRAYAGRIARTPGAGTVAGPLRTGPDLWQIDVTSRSGPYTPGSERLLAAAESLRPGVPVLATGPTAEQVSQQGHIGSRLPWAFALLVLCTVAVIVLMTGSLSLAVMTLVTNSLTIGATLGILVLVFQDGHLAGLLGATAQGGLVTTQPFLVCALAFALATDYGVFLLARTKELRDGGRTPAASIMGGVASTGRIISSAALLFCVALGVFSVSPIALIKEIGLGAALAVVIDATVVRALVVPSLMGLLGERAWWPGVAVRARRSRCGVSGPGEAPRRAEPVAAPGGGL